MRTQRQDMLCILDTHVLIWSGNDDPRLGAGARTAIEETVSSDRVAVSAITPWEIALLAERGRRRLGREVGTWIETALALPGVHLLPIVPAIAVDSVRLPCEFHSDPADRFIVSTARHHDVPLITAVRAILAYSAAGHVDDVGAAKWARFPSPFAPSAAGRNARPYEVVGLATPVSSSDPSPAVR